MILVGNLHGVRKMPREMVSLEVINFKEELARIEKEIIKIAKDDIDLRTSYATEQLRVVTPVDTGEARSGWNRKKVREGFDDFWSIYNEVEHIVYLNRGHSRQAPSYFIEQVLSQIGLK